MNKLRSIQHFKVHHKPGSGFRLGSKGKDYPSLQALIANGPSLPRPIYIRKAVDGSKFQKIFDAQRAVEKGVSETGLYKDVVEEKNTPRKGFKLW